MRTRDVVIGASIIAIGIAAHGYFSGHRRADDSRCAPPMSVTFTERRYAAVSNHATDLAARIMVIDRDTGDCRIFNCEGKNTGWVTKDDVIKLWDDK